MPWSTLVRRIQGSQADTVGMLMVEASGPKRVGDAQREVTSLLRQRHRLAEGAETDFQIRNLAEIQNSANEQTNTLVSCSSARSRSSRSSSAPSASPTSCWSR